MAATVVLQPSIFTRRNGDTAPRRLVQDVLNDRNANVQNFCMFKVEQREFADNTEARKVNRACSMCFPNHQCHLDEEVTTLGIRNLLYAPTCNVQPFWIRWTSSWNNVEENTGLSPTRQKVLNRKELCQNLLKDEESKAILKLSDDLYLPYCGFWGSTWIMKLCGWILRKIFSRMFEAVCVHLGEVELLERAHQSDLPIIYIPVNRSDIDPFMMFFTLQSLGLSSPYFFSNRRQRFWGQFFGGIGFKNSSSFDSTNTAQRSSITTTCFQMLLKQRSSISLNLEQQRSRSGKPSAELYGKKFSSFLVEFLNILRRCWKETFEDAYIVPVNISYEKLPELSNKLVWQMSIFRSMRNYLGINHGSVRVSFGQPFTLREFRVAVDANHKFKMLKRNPDSFAIRDETYRRTFLGTELCWDSNIHPALRASISSLYELPYLKDKEENFIFIESLAFHSIYASMMSITVLPTHVVGFLLLKKFRKGASFNKLCEGVRMIQKWLSLYEKDLGFTGSVEGAVFHALITLGPDHVHVTKSSNGIYVQPLLTPWSLERLGYYSNAVMPFLALEACIAVAACSLIGNELVSKMDYNDDLKVPEDTLIQESQHVYSILSSEFLLHSPCLTAKAGIRKACERLIDKNVFQSVIDSSARSQHHAFEDEIYDDNLDDEEFTALDVAFIPSHYRVIASEESFLALSFLRNLLIPYLEIYSAIALELQTLVSGSRSNPISEPDFEFMERVLPKLKVQFKEQDYGELVTMDIIKNALFAFETHEFICYEVNSETKEKSIYLNSRYDSLPPLRQLSNDILHYVTF